MAGKITVSGSGRISPSDEGYVAGWSANEVVTTAVIGQSPAGTGALNFSGAERDETDGHYSEWAISEAATFTHVADSPSGVALGSYPGTVTSVSTRGGSVDGTVAPVLNLLNAVRRVATRGDYAGYLYTAASSTSSSNDDVAFDASGDMFIKVGSEIHKYTKSGGTTWTLVTSADAGVTLITLAVDSSGLVYAVNVLNEVVRFSNDLSTSTTFSSGTGWAFANTYGIAIDSNDNIFVTDEAGVGGGPGVFKFDSSFNLITSWGGEGTGDGEFIAPRRAACDSSGDVYVSDTSLNRVQKFTNTGTYVAQVGGEGSGDGQFRSPLGIAVRSDGTVYVADLGNNRIQFFTNNLEWMGSLGSYGTGDGDLRRPGGVALEPGTDNLFVTTQTPSRSVLVYSTGGVGYTDYLSNYYQYYVDSCIPGHTIDYQASSDPLVIYPGFTGNVWNRVNELAQAHGQEIVVVNGTITIRDIMNREISIDSLISSPSLEVNAQGLARAVEVEYQNFTYGDGITIYDARQDNNRVFQVAAGRVERFTISTNNYPVIINNPSPSNALPPGPGQYRVSAADNLPVIADQWVEYGGDVTVELGENPNELLITLTGPFEEIPGVPSPYYLSVSDGQSSYATLNIAGSGVATNPQTLHLPTGVDPYLVTEATAPTISNPYIDTRADAYDRGVWASDFYTGPNVTLAADIDLEAVGAFGLAAGSWVKYADSKYRVETVTINNTSARITARRWVTAGDEEDVWDGKTSGDYDALWDNEPAKNAIIRPLRTE